MKKFLLSLLIFLPLFAFAQSPAELELNRAITNAGRWGDPRYTTTTRPTCNTSNLAAYIWNTTTSQTEYCDGSSWTAAGGGALTPGTTTVTGATSCLLYADASDVLQCNPAITTDDTVPVSNGTLFEAKAVPDSDAAGKALQYDTTTNTFSAATLYQIKRLAADFSVTDGTAYADVTGMTFTLAANTSYSIDCNGTATSAATTTALRISLNGPASPTALSFVVASNNLAASLVLQSSLELTSYDADIGATELFAGSRLWVLSGTIENGANAGTLALRLKSEIDTSQVTLKRGSFCVVY